MAHFTMKNYYIILALWEEGGFLKLGYPRFQLAFSSLAPRTQWSRQKDFCEQFPLRTSRSEAKPAKPSLEEPCQYTNKKNAAEQFLNLYAISVPNV